MCYQRVGPSNKPDSTWHTTLLNLTAARVGYGDLIATACRGWMRQADADGRNEERWGCCAWSEVASRRLFAAGWSEVFLPRAERWRSVRPDSDARERLRVEWLRSNVTKYP